MNAIGDAQDGYFIGWYLGPDFPPHLARDAGVELAHAIGFVGQPHGQDSHAKVALCIVRVHSPQSQKFVP